MRLEIVELANGWAVRPALDMTTGKGGYETAPAETHCFNRFEDVIGYIRSQSAVLKRQPPPELRPFGADPSRA